MLIEEFKMSIPPVIKKLNLMEAEEHELRNILKMCNFSFILEDCNRIQSTIIAEVKPGMTQASQRYINVEEDCTEIEAFDDITNDDFVKYRDLIVRAHDLYARMSERKEEFINSEGRPLVEWYKHGITIEDARYILPLKCKTSMVLTMDGDKLLDLYKEMYKYRYLFADLKDELSKHIPRYILDALIKNSSTKVDKLSPGVLGVQMNKLSNTPDRVALVSGDDLSKEWNTIIPSAAAHASSLKDGPTEAFKRLREGNWKDPVKSTLFSAYKLNHTSLLEHVRFSYVVEGSLVNYHQLIRHRHQTQLSGSLGQMVSGHQGLTIPKSIEQSQFQEEFIELVKEFRELGQYFKAVYGPEATLYTLLNCDNIVTYVNTNLRELMTSGILRTCYGAQWEIRSIYIELLNILKEYIPEEYLLNCLPPCTQQKGCKEHARYSCRIPNAGKKILEELNF